MRARSFTLTTTLAVLLASSLAAVAYADVIGRPADCPLGTRSARSHSGAWCTPATCDEGCDEGYECVPRRVCTVQTLVQRRGRGARGAPPLEQEQAVMSCAPTEGCTGTEAAAVPIVGDAMGQAACREMRVCVRPTLPPFPPMPEFPAAQPAVGAQNAAPTTVPAPTPDTPRASPSSCGSCAITQGEAPTAGLVVLLMCLALVVYGRARR